MSDSPDEDGAFFKSIYIGTLSARSFAAQSRNIRRRYYLICGIAPVMRFAVVFVRAGGNGGVKRQFGAEKTRQTKFLSRKHEYRTAECGGKRYFVRRVVDNRQKRNRKHYFGLFEETVVVFGGKRNAVFAENTLERRAPARRRTEKYRKIAVFQRRAVGSCRAADKAEYLCRRDGRFAFVALAGRCVRYAGDDGGERIFYAGGKNKLFVFIGISGIFGCIELFEDGVYEVYDIFTAPEILAEVNLARIAFTVNIGSVFYSVSEYTRRGVSETIYGLLHIAHEERIVSL